MSTVDRALTAVFLIARLAWWPLAVLLHALVALATPFYHVAVFASLPLLYAATAGIHIASLPFTVKWLERIEVRMARMTLRGAGLMHTTLTSLVPICIKHRKAQTLYIYLGTAALIGCITGGVLYVLFGFLSSALSVDTSVTHAASARRRTVAIYRAAKTGPEQALPKPGPAMPPAIVKKAPRFRLRQGLLSSAVMGEEEEEEESNF